MIDWSVWKLGCVGRQSWSHVYQKALFDAGIRAEADRIMVGSVRLRNEPLKRFV